MLAQCFFQCFFQIRCNGKTYVLYVSRCGTPAVRTYTKNIFTRKKGSLRQTGTQSQPSNVLQMEGGIGITPRFADSNPAGLDRGIVFTCWCDRERSDSKYIKGSDDKNLVLYIDRKNVCQ